MLSNQLAELWQEAMQDEDFRFELKAQEVAVDLASEFAKSGMTQKELAEGICSAKYIYLIIWQYKKKNKLLFILFGGGRWI